jgi:hypothetical protein
MGRKFGYRERVGREHSGMIAPATVLDWLSEPACVRTNRCEQKILRAELEVRRGHGGTAAPFRMGKKMATTRVVQLVDAGAFAGS